MNVSVPVVDCDIHPLPKSAKALFAYMPRALADHADLVGAWSREPFRGGPTYPKPAPALARRDAWPPAGGPPGSDLGFMREQHLDANGIEMGLLQPLFPSGKDQRNPEFAVALCRAVNEWQLAEWAEPEPRLKASIVVPCEDAAASVREIERWADNPCFAQVFLTMRTREPLGERRYWPIFEAAVAHDLPITIHSGGVNGLPITGAGWPSHYVEDHQSAALVGGALLASLVFNGVFEAFPTLRVVLVEAGFGWVPSLLWRMDAQWRRLGAEVPALRREPSSYVAANVWFTTQPIEEPPTHRDMLDLLEWIGFDRLLFASDYPHWDFDDPRYAIKAPLTAEQKSMILHGNARRLYGVPDTVLQPAGAGAAQG